MIRALYSLLYKNKNKKTYLWVHRFVKLFLYIFYPFYCKVIKKNVHQTTDSRVIVSLTSFPARIESVWITIETLLRQTCRPGKIILWLAEGQFQSIESLPSNLIRQQERGLEIAFCDDLRSHKKYFYSMLNYPDSIIITVDDDTFYPEDLVENLVTTHTRHPNTICCNMAHLIAVHDREIQPYLSWDSGAEGCDQPSHYLVPVGCEGVLYPPGLLHKDTFDKAKIQELCPTADDLWLKTMAALNGIKAVKCNPVSITYANLLSARASALNDVNVGQNMNDVQLGNILKHYPELREIWV